MAKEADEVLLNVGVADASKLYRFYLNQEKKILGAIAVVLFLIVWELVGNVYQLINPGYVSWWARLWIDHIDKWFHFTTQTWMSASVLSFAVAALLTLPFTVGRPRDLSPSAAPASAPTASRGADEA